MKKMTIAAVCLLTSVQIVSPVEFPPIEMEHIEMALPPPSIDTEFKSPTLLPEVEISTPAVAVREFREFQGLPSDVIER